VQGESADDCLLNNGRGRLGGYSWIEMGPSYVRPFSRCVRVVNRWWRSFVNVASVLSPRLVRLMNLIIDRPSVRPTTGRAISASHRSIRSPSLRSWNDKQLFRFIILTGGARRTRHRQKRLTSRVAPMSRRE